MRGLGGKGEEGRRRRRRRWSVKEGDRGQDGEWEKSWQEMEEEEKEGI